MGRLKVVSSFIIVIFRQVWKILLLMILKGGALLMVAPLEQKRLCRKQMVFSLNKILKILLASPKYFVNLLMFLN